MRRFYIKRDKLEMGFVYPTAAAILAVFIVSLVHTGIYWIEYDYDGPSLKGSPETTYSQNVFEWKTEVGGVSSTNPLVDKGNEKARCGNDDLTGPKDGDVDDDCCPNIVAVQGLMIAAAVCSALLVLHYALYSTNVLHHALKNCLNCFGTRDGSFGDDSRFVKVLQKVLVWLMPALACVLSLAAILIYEIDMKKIGCGGEMNPAGPPSLFKEGEYQEGFWLAVAGSAGSGIIAIVLAYVLHHTEEKPASATTVSQGGAATKLTHVNSLVF